MTEMEHSYGGDIDGNPVTTSVPARRTKSKAGLKSATVIQGHVETEEPDGTETSGGA